MTERTIAKPCPFCGSYPVWSHGKIKCKNEQCDVQPKVKHWYTVDSYEGAVSDWNKRKTTKEEEQI